MAENSEISWTHHTFNPWWGCTRVSEACRHCYAETFAKRWGTEWGPQARRKFFGDKHWREPLAWNVKAAKAGERHRVFCASMADVFEMLPAGHPDAEEMEAARLRLWALIHETPHLDWLLLTKRPENIRALAMPLTVEGYPPNAWFGTTVESQAEAEKRIPCLLEVNCAVRFLSCEPLLGPLDLSPFVYPRWVKNDKTKTGTDGVGRPLYTCQGCGEESTLPHGQCARQGVVQGHVEITCAMEPSPIHWVIVGGESGAGARPMHPDWARRLRDHCRGLGVPYHFKQWGEYIPTNRGMDTGSCFSFVHGVEFEKVGKKAAGRALDGQYHDAFPLAPAGREGGEHGKRDH